jgi:hypothetical protein
MINFTITSNVGMMPNQIEGTTSDGRFFYFRARHGFATLYIGNTLDQCYEGVEVGPNKTMVWSNEVAGAGWLTPDEYESLFWRVIADLEKPDEVP